MICCLCSTIAGVILAVGLVACGGYGGEDYSEQWAVEMTEEFDQ